MNGFPMQAMPEGMRMMYVEKMTKGVRDGKTKFGVAGTVTIDIVDGASGDVMATVTASSRRPSPLRPDSLPRHSVDGRVTDSRGRRGTRNGIRHRVDEPPGGLRSASTEARS